MKHQLVGIALLILVLALLRFTPSTVLPVGGAPAPQQAGEPPRTKKTISDEFKRCAETLRKSPEEAIKDLKILKPLPYAESERAEIMGENEPLKGGIPGSIADFIDEGQDIKEFRATIGSKRQLSAFNKGAATVVRLYQEMVKEYPDPQKLTGKALEIKAIKACFGTLWGEVGVNTLARIATYGTEKRRLLIRSAELALACYPLRTKTEGAEQCLGRLEAQ